MNALLRHKWGVSQARDRVWSQVTGLSPQRAVKRLLMAIAFQAFVDESISRDEFVLGGHIASPEAWAQFSEEWDGILSWGTLTADGRYHFKMSEMAQSPERMERVPLFYRLIEKHVVVSISLRINLQEFNSAHDAAVTFMHRSTNSIIDFKELKNPYFFAVRHLIDNFYRNQKQFKFLAGEDRKIDFIFDDRTDKEPILRGYKDVIDRAEDDIKSLYGATPRFESDLEFLPLQAADLWAWWAREWYEYENSDAPEAMRNFDFGTWKGKKRPFITFTMDQKQLLDAFILAAYESIAEVGDNARKQF